MGSGAEGMSMRPGCLPVDGSAKAVTCAEAIADRVVPSDEDLMLLITSGDQGAFGLLFDRHYRLVRGVARRILGDSAEVADVVQEAFIYVYKYARTFDRARGPLVPWISKVTYHQALKRSRQLNAVPLEFFSNVHDAPTVEDSNMMPDRRNRMLDFHRALEEALECLSEVQRHAIRLVYYENRKLPEVAVELRRTYVSTRRDFYKGLRKIAAELAQSRRLEGYREFETPEDEGKL